MSLHDDNALQLEVLSASKLRAHTIKENGSVHIVSIIGRATKYIISKVKVLVFSYKLFPSGG